jgi:hypothetical protein
MTMIFSEHFFTLYPEAFIGLIPLLIGEYFFKKSSTNSNTKQSLSEPNQIIKAVNKIKKSERHEAVAYDVCADCTFSFQPDTGRRKAPFCVND